MDTVTHALLGALVARVATTHRSRLSTRERLLLGAGAAAFPDIDFLGFPIDPLVFLADWHQGPTHSLVLLPFWALLLSGLFIAVIRRRGVFLEVALICALALASHIASDAITAYGTKLLDPLSDQRFSFVTTFAIDPLFTGLIALALGASLWTGRRAIAGLGLLALCLYVGGQALLRQQALELGHEYAHERGIAAESVAALPQPFSPFNWKLVVTERPWIHQTHVNLAGHPPPVPDVIGLRRLRAIAVAYRPPRDPVWERRHRFGEREELRELVEELWQRPDFAPFRRFAVHPALSRIDRTNGETCVWFTDLRYDLPALPDTFRYGFCRGAPAEPWRLYRLRYFTEAARQMISSYLMDPDSGRISTNVFPGISTSKYVLSLPRLLDDDMIVDPEGLWCRRAHSATYGLELRMASSPGPKALLSRFAVISKAWIRRGLTAKKIADIVLVK